jgi:hypothetical protein
MASNNAWQWSWPDSTRLSGRAQEALPNKERPNGQNVTQVLEALVPLGLKEIHLSGGMWVESAASFRREGMRMGVGQNEWSVWRTQADKVREVRYALDSHSQEHANLYPLAPVVFESPSVPEGTESAGSSSNN